MEYTNIQVIGIANRTLKMVQEHIFSSSMQMVSGGISIQGTKIQVKSLFLDPKIGMKVAIGCLGVQITNGNGK